MARPKALVLRSAGTNCDRETAFALTQAGFDAERVHVFRLIEDPARLDEYQFMVIAGGFSYGDDVAAGKILANQMLHRLADALNAFLAADKLVLGICNGFQVMIKAGILPWGTVAADQAHRDATLAWNDCGKFEDRWVHLRADSDKCVFLPKGEIIALPVAHGEGKFVTRDAAVLDKIRPADVILLHIGTNGLSSDPTQVEEILDNIDIWEAANHPVWVVRARIINRPSDSSLPEPDYIGSSSLTLPSWACTNARRPAIWKANSLESTSWL